MAAATQSFPLPFLYVNDLQIAWVSNTSLSVSSGRARNSTNVQDIQPSSATIDATTNGINGLDVGSLAASTWYYVFAVGSSLNSAVPGFLISTSATAPTLPAGGYDEFKLIGAWLTDSSVHFINGYYTGTGNVRSFFYDTPIKVINNGAATTGTVVDLSGAVPPIQNTPVSLSGTHSPAAAGGYAGFTPGDSSATPIAGIAGSVGSQINTGSFNVLSRLVTAKASIKYLNSAASGSTNVWVTGFTLYV